MDTYLVGYVVQYYIPELGKSVKETKSGKVSLRQEDLVETKDEYSAIKGKIWDAEQQKNFLGTEEIPGNGKKIVSIDLVKLQILGTKTLRIENVNNR